ncbi:hypothetical protein NADFUDRAFT_48558 [Nadsonia fulvescens var. elongata DSM 6958]|uniref:Uncharacterized protein n=1 Tax=Nadsonia fulvescens var. elongata DSM 6958 TaxID=857566 RepID=A0A1E3PSU6_9ASCO|nr:hypothetical protein NADFUDRAFT_48558 [Nadsonia fulvescens var. elongata DSM 6958]
MLFTSRSTGESPSTSSEVRRQLFKRPATRSAAPTPVGALNVPTIPLCESGLQVDDVDMNIYHTGSKIASSPTNFIYGNHPTRSSNDEDIPVIKVSAHPQDMDHVTVKSKRFFLGRDRISARHSLDGMVMEDGDLDDDGDFLSSDFNFKRSSNVTFNTICASSERNLLDSARESQTDRLYSTNGFLHASPKLPTKTNSYARALSSKNESDIILGFHPDPEKLVTEAEFGQEILEKEANDEALKQWMEHAYVNEDTRNMRDVQVANRAMLLEVVRNSDESRWLYETVCESIADI